jgi:hypothetical protein
MPHNPGGPGGMGSTPFDSDHYAGYRDFGPGEPRPKDVIFDPSRTPPKSGQSTTPGSPEFFNELIYRLMAAVKNTPLLVKRPAFIEPPFFAKPQIKFGGGGTVIPHAGAPVFIYDRILEARQKLVITSIGIGVDTPKVYTDHNLMFWFADGSPDAVIPLFDDQSPATASHAGFQRGMTTMIPGSMEQPYSLIRDGCSLVIEGPKRVQFYVQNFDPALDVEAQIITGIYQYWIPNAAEFEKADQQI